VLTTKKRTPKAALAALATAAVTLAPPPLALAADTDAAVDSAVATAVDAVRAAGGAVKTGAEVLAAGFKALQQGYEAAAPVVKQAADLAAPALREAAGLAAPALKQAAPAVTGALSSAAKASGVDVGSLGSAAREAADFASAGAAAATPAIGKLAAFLADKDPLTLGEYGLGAVAASYVAPALGGAIAGGLRGYAGDLTPVQALDALANEGSAVLIDVRSARDKESQGLPEVASSASGRVLEVEFASTDDRRLRSALRDPQGVELKVTALQIAGLKRASKGARLIILDRSGGQAKQVARELSKLGFRKAFVVQGGFDSWVRSKLLVKPAALAFSSAPASLPAVIARTISTRPATPSSSTKAASSTRKALPAGR
jgi:rhodanese-related sulfurtransferase